MRDLFELDRQYVANTYERAELSIKSGKGSLLYDALGNRYIDLGSGIAVNVFGLCDDVWIEAVTRQIKTLQHASNLYYTRPQAELAELLCEKTGMKRVFFSNSGAEANECAIKAARKYASDRYDAKRSTILTLLNSFHGRTLTTLSATGQEGMHKHFGPFTPGFLHIPANDIPAMEEAMENSDVCAVMIELIQGEGGVNVLDKAYVQALAKKAKERGILLIADEVQTGNGRTGKLYAYMHYGIEPDIVTTAKGLAGGLPLGATMFAQSTEDVLGPGTHGSTFGGNPVCAAGALSILSRITNELMDEVTKKGLYIVNALRGAKGVVRVTGMGLMLGVETEAPAAGILAQCRKNGVIVLTSKTKLRLLPALNIPMDLLEGAVNVLQNVLSLS